MESNQNREREEEAASFHQRDDSSSMAPRDLDVLFGRGRPLHKHPGNKRLNQIVKQFRSLYQQSERGQKAQILKAVVCIVRDASSENAGFIRFLKRRRSGRHLHGSVSTHSEQWTEATESEVLDKVSHILRERPRACDGTTSSKMDPVARIKENNWVVNDISSSHNTNEPTGSRNPLFAWEPINAAADDLFISEQKYTNRDISGSLAILDAMENSDENEDCLYKYFCDFQLCEPGTPPSPSIFDDICDDIDSSDCPSIMANSFYSYI